MTVEHLLPEYLAEEILPQLSSPFRLRRINFGGRRFYYEAIEKEDGYEVMVYLSSTTFIKAVLPENKFLTNWRIDLAVSMSSAEKVDEYVDLTADYGTIMHVSFAEIVKRGRFVPDRVTDVVANYVTENNTPANLHQKWTEAIMMDCLSFLQFVHDYEVKVIAIEFPIKYRGVGTCIDLVAEITTKEKGFWGEEYKSGEKKGEPKESYRLNTFVAIIDFKSGRKGFYDSHEAQLEYCKEAWNSFFAGTKYEAKKVFNWAPNDWRDKPTYKIKDQSSTRFTGKLDTLYSMGEIFDIFEIGKTKKRVTSEIPLGETTDGSYEIIDLKSAIVEYEKKLKNEGQIAEGPGASEDAGA